MPMPESILFYYFIYKVVNLELLEVEKALISKKLLY